MKNRVSWCQALVLGMATLASLGGDGAGKVASLSVPERIEAGLTLWPPESRHSIATAVAAATGMDNPFATFDADGTLWSSDATEAFLAYLDAQGVLTPAFLDPALKLVPFLPGEGIYSYYQRLCAQDKAIGYPWCAQVFAGFTIAELRQHYAAMMKTRGSTVAAWTAVAGQAPVARQEFVAVPKLFPQQVQLIQVLEQNGIRVFIVTASPEELVHFLACAPAADPGFNLNLPPERVIGVNVLLRDDKTGDVTSSRLRLNKTKTLFDATNPRERWESRRLTSFVLPPVTMYTGKVAAITAFIHPTQRPVLAAGDSASDFPMLFYSAGARLWVDHSCTAPGIVERALETNRNTTAPGRGWIRATWDRKTQP
jgi:phosphoserine phosphatase